MENRIREKMELTLQLIREYAQSSGWQRVDDLTTATYRALDEIERREDEE